MPLTHVMSFQVREQERAREPQRLALDRRSQRSGTVAATGHKPEQRGLITEFLAVNNTTLAGQPAEPEFVHQRLCENPAFARTCGFTIPRPGKSERQSDIPSLRRLDLWENAMRPVSVGGGTEETVDEF